MYLFVPQHLEVLEAKFVVLSFLVYYSGGINFPSTIVSLKIQLVTLTLIPIVDSNSLSLDKKL